MVGELVGARLIAHAGSLMNLAKQPASTVQILGAEKARALLAPPDLGTVDTPRAVDFCFLWWWCVWGGGYRPHPSPLTSIPPPPPLLALGAVPRAQGQARHAQVRAHLPRVARGAGPRHFRDASETFGAALTPLETPPPTCPPTRPLTRPMTPTRHVHTTRPSDTSTRHVHRTRPHDASIGHVHP